VASDRELVRVLAGDAVLLGYELGPDELVELVGVGTSSAKASLGSNESQGEIKQVITLLCVFKCSASAGLPKPWEWKYQIRIENAWSQTYIWPFIRPTCGKVLIHIREHDFRQYKGG